MIHIKSFTLKSTLPATKCYPQFRHGVRYQDYIVRIQYFFKTCPLFFSFVTTSTTMANTSGDKTANRCTTTFTSSSSDKCFPTFNCVFAPFHRLITTPTNASGIAFFLIAHSTNFMGAQSDTIFLIYKAHVQLLLFG